MGFLWMGVRAASSAARASAKNKQAAADAAPVQPVRPKATPEQQQAAHAYLVARAQQRQRGRRAR